MNDSERKILHHYNHSHRCFLGEGMAGCYHCVRLFSVEHLGEWVNEREGQTALCPYCSIDSVLPQEAIVHLIFVRFGINHYHPILAQQVLKAAHDDQFGIEQY